MNSRFLLLALVLSAAGCGVPPKQVPIFDTVPPGKLEWVGEMPVLKLSGSPYQMGYQHGTLLRREVRASVKNIMAFADQQLRVPGLGRLVARRKLDRAWKQMKPHVPERYLEEMQGLSDGAEIPLRTLQRVHALPDLTSVTCASSVVAGPATQDGRLIQIRNLDWAIQSNVQRYAALMVYEPAGKKPFVSIGWLGFIGVLSGISRSGISVAQIGAETQDSNLRGVPMPFLLRRVLEESDDLKQAVKIIEEGPRTVGYNYLFADAKARSAVALETTRQHSAVFWMGPESRLVRADYPLDPVVRGLQTEKSPEKTKAYQVRYRGQEQLLEKFHGKINPEIAMAIASAIAPSSNIQSVVYATPQIWIASAYRRRPAAQGAYLQVDLEDLFTSS
ncbi:MAG: C45 family peptidase [Candidatus Omnitrophota bacterium]|nr:C45 family peptidase [Candidatus Omnitrophota bacterium]